MSMKISKEAIEAGARAFWGHYEKGLLVLPWQDLTDEQRERLQRCLAEGFKAAFIHPTTPVASSDTPSEDEEALVRRVMAALHEAGCGHVPNFKPFWESYHADEGSPQREKYERAARAAIREIRGSEQRWGIECTGPNERNWLLHQDPKNGNFFTWDKQAAELICGIMNQTHGIDGLFRYSVRPCPAEKTKTPEKIADDILAPFSRTTTTQLMRGSSNHGHLRKMIAAAIRDAKGAK